MLERRINFLKKDGIILIILWGICLIPQIGSIFCLIFLIYKSIKDNNWTVKALFFALSIRMLNPFLFSPGIMKSFGSWVLLLFVFIKVLFMKPEIRFRNSYLMFLFFLFCFEIFISSYLKSPFIGISLFKLISFCIGFYAVYRGYQNKISYQWDSLFFTFWQLIVWMSIPFLFVRSLGYAINGVGFQGITLHPQSFGTILAPLTIYFGYLIFNDRSNIRQNYLLSLTTLLSSIVMLILTQSRTAVFSLIISLIIYLLYKFSLRLRSKQSEIRVSLKAIFLILLFTFVAVLKYDRLAIEIKKFVVKREDDTEMIETEVNGEKLLESRKDAVTLSMNNFKENIWFGIGFGIPSNVESFKPQFLSGTDIPISAPVEKGIIGPALLEENGLIGTILFSIWIAAMSITILRYGSPEYLMLFFTMFIVNFGEFIFFSANGFGIYAWFLMLLAYFKALESKMKRGLPNKTLINRIY